MEEYRSNSNKLKEKEALPEKKVTAAVTSAKKVEESKLRKIKKAIIADDAQHISSYILFDVMIPNIKKAISETITRGVDMILYGGTKSSSNSNVSRVSYRTAYSSASCNNISTPSRNAFDYEQILFETRGDAEAVLSAMDDILSTYPTVSVGDLYDLADISTDNYMVNKYGWSDISRAEVVRSRDGYVIKLPKAMPITK